MPPPSPLLFIDANIYLKFYEARRDHLRTMLAALAEAAPYVFVTVQIENEVRRNQCNAFRKQISDMLKSVPSKLQWSSFHPRADSATRKNWNRRVTRLEQRIASAKKAYLDAADKMAEKIRASIDPVSKELDGIFSTAVEATDEELAAARLRKERGNPPGKRGDPLGDQLSWEQLLNKVRKGQSVWIISQDGDYWDEHFEGKVKAPLQRELRAKLGASGKIHGFPTIDAALKHFSSNAVTLKKLPPKKEQRDIAEENANTSGAGLGSFGDMFVDKTFNFPVWFQPRRQTTIGADHFPVTKCAKCRSTDIVLKHQGGAGLNMALECANCGTRFTSQQPSTLPP
jgi:hypothetical protein